MFLATADTDPPQLMLARVRAPRDFKLAVEQMLGRSEKERIDIINDRFLLNVVAPELLPHGTAFSLDRFLRKIAREILDDAPLYNSTKHGLATRHKMAEFSVYAETADAEQGLTGLSQTETWLTTVEIVGFGDEAHWTETSRSIEPDRLMAMTDVICGLLDSLWAVGRARVASSNAVLTLPNVDQVDAILNVDTRIHMWRRDLVYDDGRDPLIRMVIEEPKSGRPGLEDEAT